MADVYAIFGSLLALGIAFPGMLTAVWLLFPARVELSRKRITTTPWRCFWLGLGVSFVLGIPIIVLFVLPYAPAKLIGGIGLTLALTFSTLGTAGIVAGMAARLQGDSDVKLITPSAFVKSAVALELAAFFPFIGWLIVIPLGIIFSLGAATFALFRREQSSRTSTEPSQEVFAEIQPVR